MRQLLGAPPANPPDEVTKAYVDGTNVTGYSRQLASGTVGATRTEYAPLSVTTTQVLHLLGGFYLRCSASAAALLTVDLSSASGAIETWTFPVVAGAQTISLPFILENRAPLANVTFKMGLKVSAGTVTFAANDLVWWMSGRLQGVKVPDLPDRSVKETLDLWFTDFGAITDTSDAALQTPVPADVSDLIDLWFTDFTGLDDTPSAGVNLIATMGAVSVAGTTVTWTGAQPGQTFTVRLTNRATGLPAGADVFTADATGQYSNDLAAHFSLSAGTYDGTTDDWPTATFVLTV